MLRASGPEALLEFAVIVVDEIHERSEQSDLLLACLREFMLHDRRLQPLRLVLMSATFQTVRYSNYFKDLGDGGKSLHVLPIPQRTEKLLGRHIHDVKLQYLEEALEILDTDGNDSAAAADAAAATGDGTGDVDGPLTAPERQNIWDFDADVEESTVSPMIHRLVSRLLYRIHGPGAISAAAERGGEAAAAAASMDRSDSTALVFLPTYRTLEEQHQLLSRLGCFRIAVLHSSVDIHESLRSIGATATGDAEDDDDENSVPMTEDGEIDEVAAAELRKPKVILSTNVAESSLTIPGVSLVIDLCRRLQVSWDLEKGVTKAEILWASKSQCTQRTGRAGRTISGSVFRLVPRTLYTKGVEGLPGEYRPAIQEWEPSELVLSDLAESSLLLATAAHRTMRAVEKMMSLCIDRPDPLTVTDAIRRLIGWGLLKAKDRKATTFGAIIGQLPLSLLAGRLAVIGCCVGLMQPAAVLAAVLSTTPEPILKSLGEREEHEETLSRFSGSEVASGNRSGALLAQLAAYEWWEAAWVDRIRLRKLDVTLAEPPSCALCAGLLSSADTLALQTTGGNICLDCKAKQQQQDSGSPETAVAIAVAQSQSESSEERWCRREGLSLVALRAVKQTADVVQAVLAKSDVRQALWDPRNRQCPQALWPARALDRPVDCRLTSVADALGDGEVIDQLHQLVDTVVAPPQPSAGGSAEDLAAERERLGMDPSRVPPCKYFSLGGGNCWEGGGSGHHCTFRHVSLPGERKPNCPFFYGAGGGCRFGSSCKFSHPRSKLLDELRLAAGIVAGKPAYESALASQRLKAGSEGGSRLRGLMTGKNVMLLGEGDFSFALSLASTMPRPARLLASGLDDEEALLRKYPDWPSTKASLGSLAMVSHGVDATLLGQSETFRDILKSSTVVLDVIGWQFPFNGKDEDTVGNAAMVGSFLRGVSAAAWRHNRVDESLRVFITVQGDQAARWHVIRSARDALFYLEDLMPFDPLEFDGYLPKHTTDPLEPLELKRPLTLVFRPCKPCCFATDVSLASGWDTESASSEDEDAMADGENDGRSLEDLVEDMVGGGVDLDEIQNM